MPIIRDKGYDVRIRCYDSAPKESQCLYFAIGDGIQLVAMSAPELLGLVIVWDTYGRNSNKQQPNITSDITTNVGGDDEDDDSVAYVG